MASWGGTARAVEFARDQPERALVFIEVDGRPQAHSWDLRRGSLVTGTDGDVAAALISPDGQWLWWYDGDSLTWYRSPFGSSPRGHRERPLRLLPSPDVDVVLGGDGTAIVSRPAPGTGRTLALLPVGRLRPGAEPTFLGSFPRAEAIFRSPDDALVAVDTGGSIEVCSAYTGTAVAAESTGRGWRTTGFTRDGSLLLTRATPGSDAPSVLTAACLWNPRTALRQPLPLASIERPTRLVLAYGGAAAVVEAVDPATGQSPARTAVYSLPFDGAEPTRIGPTHGTLEPGTAVGGPGGEGYAVWSAEGYPRRLVNLSRAEAALESLAAGEPLDLSRAYPPAVGGYGG